MQKILSRQTTHQLHCSETLSKVEGTHLRLPELAKSPAIKSNLHQTSSRLMLPPKNLVHAALLGRLRMSAAAPPARARAAVSPLRMIPSFLLSLQDGVEVNAPISESEGKSSRLATSLTISTVIGSTSMVSGSPLNSVWKIVQGVKVKDPVPCSSKL